MSDSTSCRRGVSVEEYLHTSFPTLMASIGHRACGEKLARLCPRESLRSGRRLFAAQVLPEWIKRNLAGACCRERRYPLTSCLTPAVRCRSLPSPFAHASLWGMEKVNLREKFSLFNDYWKPKIIGELNSQQVKLVKFLGPFVWHHSCPKRSLKHAGRVSRVK